MPDYHHYRTQIIACKNLRQLSKTCRAAFKDNTLLDSEKEKITDAMLNKLDELTAYISESI